uniref:Uncharacterized protein n=1 Tax=Romanomermis culicivorax TaxID=13658 RepID=A0A915KJL5_ROMCU
MARRVIDEIGVKIDIGVISRPKHTLSTSNNTLSNVKVDMTQKRSVIRKKLKTEKLLRLESVSVKKC